MAEAPARPSPAQPPSAVRLRGLRRDYGAVRALDGLDLDIPAGRVFGLLGPNGAGKTTTLHILLGILPPTSGTAEVLGLDVARHPDAVRRRTGVLLEHDGLYERLTAEENLLFHARAHGLADDEARSRMEALLGPAGLWERRGDRLGTWSRGMKRRLGVVRAFLHTPSLVFLDEPTSGLDARAAAETRELVRHRAREQGVTVVLTTHDLAEAEALCDEVAVLDAGRRVAQGPPHRLHGAETVRVEFVGTFPARFVSGLRRRASVRAVERGDHGITIEMDDGAPVAPLVAAAVQAGAEVEEVRRVRAGLEESFLRILERGR